MTAPNEPARWHPTEPEPTWLAADRRPKGVDDKTVEAVGKLSKALEVVERARGRLYDFHQMIGNADLLLGEAVDQLAEIGFRELADDLDRHLVGRNVLKGRWTFQIVEEFDATYWRAFCDAAHSARAQLLDGVDHVYESELKDRRRSAGTKHHERRPAP